MTSSKEIKYLFVARGPGEAGQARSLAKYVATKGGVVLFALLQKENLHFFSHDKNFQLFLTETPQRLKRVIAKEKPEVFLIFNSKAWAANKAFREKPLFKKPCLTLCVDSNWLFNNKKYPNFPFIPWADKYLVLFPKKIFELGLKKNGGGFVIPRPTLKQVIPVGFIPTYPKVPAKERERIRKKYKVQKDEKFIFSYFSGFGAGHRVFAFNNLIASVDRLIKKGRKIKVLYVGPTEDIDEKKLSKTWLLKEEKISAKEYFVVLSASDLVFQHQGMVTLSQAISAGVPVIANVHLLKELPPSVQKLHFWEVAPFDKAGSCKMFSKSTTLKKIGLEIDKLLYNTAAIKKMTKAQRAIFEKGEGRAFSIIQKLLKEKICPN